MFHTNLIRGANLFVTPGRYHQTNSAQALKETSRFTQLNADPCSYARVCLLHARMQGYVYTMLICKGTSTRCSYARVCLLDAHMQGYAYVMLTLTLVRCASIGSWRERQNLHRARFGYHTEVSHMNLVRSLELGLKKRLRV